jgi:hypothetical protein
MSTFYACLPFFHPHSSISINETSLVWSDLSSVPPIIIRINLFMIFPSIGHVNGMSGRDFGGCGFEAFPCASVSYVTNWRQNTIPVKVVMLGDSFIDDKLHCLVDSASVTTYEGNPVRLHLTDESVGAVIADGLIVCSVPTAFTRIHFTLPSTMSWYQ